MTPFSLPWPAPLLEATLLRRYHRFLTDARLPSGEVVQAHCVNTGAMEGLVRPGCRVFLCPAPPGRKLPYTWVSSEVEPGLLVGVDTSLPNRLVRAMLEARALPAFARRRGVVPEAAMGHRSRVDFRVELAGGPALLEVKNCHLVYPDGGAYFPDSVSDRGARHLRELAAVARRGGRASVLFVVQRDDARFVRPSDAHDPEFAAQARAAFAAGVRFSALRLRPGPAGVDVLGSIPVDLAPYPPEQPRAWRAQGRRWSGWERPGRQEKPDRLRRGAPLLLSWLARMPSPPRILGRYALYEAIASGGMASIHIGRLLGPVGFSRTVAVKRLHEQFARDPEFVAMFLDEARIAARIRHPNVVPTIDVVALENELFLVMEFIQGESLSHLLKHARNHDERVPLPIVSKIMGEMLMGLHAAHEAKNERGEPLNIVHRDVSPQNALVGADGVTRVVDFGIAKAVGRMAQTREGQIKGKVQYMAPEQISGKDVTRSVDIYAASVILWEAVAGRRLMKAENDVEAMYQIMESTPERLRSLDPNVPLALEELVARGLQKNAADRFATAREMALALDAAVPPASSAVVSDWVQRIAGERLSQRNEQIARIESEDTPANPPTLAESGAFSTAQAPPAQAFEQPTNPSATVPALPMQPAARTPLLVGVGLVAVVGAVFVGRSLRSEAPQAPASGPVAALSAPAAVAPPASASASPAPPATMAAASAAASAASAAPPAASAPVADKTPRPADKAKKPPGSPAVAPAPASQPAKGPAAIYQRD